MLSAASLPRRRPTARRELEMIDVEVIGIAAARSRAAVVADASAASDVPNPAALRDLARLAAARAGVLEGHLAVEFVDAARIAALNAEHRGEAGATDVLSFPI